MAKNLIIVESPAKVKTIKKFLGRDYNVMASVGHIRDLPVNSIAVDEEHDFAPQYEIIKGKEKIVRDLQSEAKKADTIYLAPDPDREGEAIAWHIGHLLDSDDKIKRIQFNEITPKAVREAIASPRELNKDLFEAQQARRILDRLVGYKISPILWRKVKRGISAGRVQSVALRLIVEREEERNAFIPEEYWQFKSMVEASNPPPFRLDLNKIKGKKAHVKNGEEAEKLDKYLKEHPYVVADIIEKERQKSPPPPFITSTLQQAANQRLNYPSKRTMNIAQRLYEGVDLGDRGILALITYMRTDSVRIADDAVKAAAEFINGKYGKEFMASGGKGRHFKGKQGAQDAHEAIRPIDVNITPDEIKPYVAPEQFQIYRLIWSRFVASQMAAAKFHDTNIIVNCGVVEWKTKGERLLFQGFLAAMPNAKDENEDNSNLPKLTIGEELKLLEVKKEQKFTQPPSRYSEASLVKELEEQGIGRPSTYASIISTLQDREYVQMVEKNFIPTGLGNIVCSQLRDHFKQLMDVKFTAQMEEKLDEVADGKQDWINLLRGFTDDFNPTLQQASKNMERMEQEANIDCPECSKPLMIKFGKAGEFLACSGYPECRYTNNFVRDEEGNVQIAERVKPEYEKAGTCPKCGEDTVIKKARTGSRFIACSAYPKCDHAAPFTTGVKCPNTDCTGDLVEKSTKRGKLFFACNRYPDCSYALWDMPIAEPCPECNFPILTKKTTKARGDHIACPNCKYKRDL